MSKRSMQAKHEETPRIVIVGVGFGGLNAARNLAGQDVDVLMLDKNNYHGFWPLLYQVATAGLEAESIAYPVRAIFHRSRNIRFRMTEVRSIDLDARKITTTGKPLTYDYLILAAGSANNYFGNNALAQHTFGLKDIEDAERLRNKMLLAFEQASTERDPDVRKAMMTFAVIGGGPTGVELSGALSELVHHVLVKDYPMLDVTEARIILIEAADRILASFPESLQKSARETLERMKVDVRLNAPVDSVDADTIRLKDGSTIAASTVIWAAGVRSAPLADTLNVELARSARVKITPELHLPGHPEVFVVGDMAYLEGYKGEATDAYPMVAQVAIQQGKHAANNILRRLRGESLQPFKYFDPGTMATIGRRSAVLDAFGVQLSGRLAWFGWLFIHIMYLVGFRNRVIVLTNWAFNYFTFERGVRLITGNYLPEEEVLPTENASSGVKREA